MKSVWGVGTMSMISRFWATYAMNTGFQFTVEASKQTYTSIHVGRYRLTYSICTKVSHKSIKLLGSTVRILPFLGKTNLRFARQNTIMFINFSVNPCPP
jgi:hypothetical protein